MGPHADGEAFARMHRGPDVLVLPNAWDAASARMFEIAGCSAIATTSAGVAWALGYPDGQRAPVGEVIAVVRRIVRAVRVPVSADLESGYANAPEGVADTVRRVLDAGAVGINLEDAPGDDGSPLRDPADQARRLEAARRAAERAGVAMVLNARTDVYWRAVGAPQERLSEAQRRLGVYRQAGADCLFVPGVTDEDTIAALVRGAGAPLNILAGPSSPDIAAMRRLGVARVTFGSGPARAAISLVGRLASELLRDGTYSGLASALAYAEADGMFSA